MLVGTCVSTLFHRDPTQLTLFDLYRSL